MSRAIGLRTTLGAILLALCLARPAVAQEERFEIPTRQGVTQTFYVTRAADPVATLVLFTGGDGRLLNYGPPSPDRGNFLLRSRNLFVEQGFTVVVVDVPSDQRDGFGTFRLTNDHATDIVEVVKWLKAATPTPIWLVGTSRGTISAALGASAAPELVSGLVLTSSLTREPKRLPGTVLHAGLGKITAPTLIISHRQDICLATPPGAGNEIMDALTKVRHKDFLLLDGGLPARSEPCEALAPHGYIGIESQVVRLICDWIRQAAPPKV